MMIDPSHERIFESKDPFKDFFTVNDQGWVVPDTQKIKNLGRHVDFVIANCSTEHWGGGSRFPLVRRLRDMLGDHLQKDFVCLSHDPQDDDPANQIVYFPYYAYRGWKKHTGKPNLEKIQRKFLLSNLNFIARDFRIACYLMLSESNYADRCCVSLHNQVQQNHHYDGDFDLTPDESKKWLEIGHTLPKTRQDNHQGIFKFTHPAFSDSYLHLASESTIKEKIFLTEKTWQPIASGQIFLVWGNSGIISHLRDLGVDVFDDILDHSYDRELDHRSRLSGIKKELDRISTLPIDRIYNDTLVRRSLNSQRVLDGSFVKYYLGRLKNLLPTQYKNLL